MIKHLPEEIENLCKQFGIYYDGVHLKYKNIWFADFYNYRDLEFKYVMAFMRNVRDNHLTDLSGIKWMSFKEVKENINHYVQLINEILIKIKFENIEKDF